MKLVLFEMKKIMGAKIWWIILLLFLLNAGLFYVHLIPSIPTSLEKEEYAIWQQKVEEMGDKKAVLSQLSDVSREILTITSVLNKEDYLSQEEIEQTKKSIRILYIGRIGKELLLR